MKKGSALKGAARRKMMLERGEKLPGLITNRVSSRCIHKRREL